MAQLHILTPHGGPQVRNWMFTTFYVAAELWGDVVLSLLFWGLANEMTTMKEVRL